MKNKILLWIMAFFTLPCISFAMDTGKWLEQNHNLFKSGTVVFGIIFFILLVWEVITTSKNKVTQNEAIRFDEINIVQDVEEEDEDPIKSLIRSQITPSKDKSEELPTFLRSDTGPLGDASKGDAPSGLLFKDKESDYTDPFKKLLQQGEKDEVRFNSNWQYEEDDTLPARMSVPKSHPQSAPTPAVKNNDNEDEPFKNLLKEAKKEPVVSPESFGEIDQNDMKTEISEQSIANFIGDTTEMPAVHENVPEPPRGKIPMKLSIQIPEKKQDTQQESVVKDNKKSSNESEKKSEELKPKQPKIKKTEKTIPKFAAPGEDKEKKTRGSQMLKELPLNLEPEKNKSLKNQLQLSPPGQQDKVVNKGRLVELELSPRKKSDKTENAGRNPNLSLNLEKPDKPEVSADRKNLGLMKLKRPSKD
jgi:hypothetical protein